MLTRLPIDLVNIIEEYAKDRTTYDRVIREFEKGAEDAINDLCECRYYSRGHPSCSKGKYFYWNPRCHDERLHNINYEITETRLGLRRFLMKFWIFTGRPDLTERFVNKFCHQRWST